MKNGVYINNTWSDPDTKFLINNYGYYGNQELSRILNKSYNSIRIKLRNLNLKRQKNFRKEFFQRTMTGKNHPRYGITTTDEIKNKISQSKKKNPTRYWLGKKRDKETNKKISLTKKKSYKSGEYQAWFKGKKFSNDHKKRLSESRLKLFREGNITHPMKGKKHTEETKGKMSISRKGKYCLENHPMWRGGISFEPCGPRFNIILKKSIRKRDNFTCQECGISEDMIVGRLSIHHIDYNKNNNSIFNLISLCRTCHGITQKDREHWKEHFQMKIFIKELFNPQNLLIFNESKLIGAKKI